MKEIHQKIIDAVIRKAESVCPESLALIGVYGSVATGDTHEKSDLDLLILINAPRGRQLADAFILDDVEIGYDVYCTDWDMLERDAACDHAHLSKLLDSQLIYVKDPSAVDRLEELRSRARNLLASEERFQKSKAALDSAKRNFSECFLTDSMSQIRTKAGETILALQDAIMLFHGRYFQRGVKRTFEELNALALPFDMEALTLEIICAETPADIRTRLTELLKTVQAILVLSDRKAAPSPDNLAGTYEEMFSNWRNKMWESENRQDLYSSFINMVCCQLMLDNMAGAVDIHATDMMQGFTPRDLHQNAAAFDYALRRYLDEYRKIGIQPRRFANIDAYLTE